MSGPFDSLELSQAQSRATEPKRKAPISGSSSKFQDRRRAEALKRQQQARQHLKDRARQVALTSAQESAPQEEEDLVPAQDTAGVSGQSFEESRPPGSLHHSGPGENAVAEYYSHQLIQPEWLVEVPIALAEHWYVMPRPEGKRCLVIAARGVTHSRLRNGRLLHRFQSGLPNGSRVTQCGQDAFCILDCIFQEPMRTYYVQDLLCWKGYSLYDCTAEFRLFWVASKLAETSAGAPPGEQHRYPFVPVPAHQCTPDGLLAAYSGPVPFVRDGCYLLHKDGQYIPGQTPLALLWKDAKCSSYVVDTDAKGVVPTYQNVTLQFAAERAVCTGDDPPFTLGRIPEDFAQQTAAVLKPGRLLRFSIREGGLQFRDGEPVGADLHFEGPANQRRGKADACSKIIFQHLARTKPVGIEQLLAAAGGTAMH